MTCSVSLACPGRLFEHDGRLYCAAHLQWAEHPEYFERPNPLANPAVVIEDQRDYAGRRPMRLS
jgi:hypothetical protein